jgi:hypothetical protein
MKMNVKAFGWPTADPDGLTEADPSQESYVKTVERTAVKPVGRRRSFRA